MALSVSSAIAAPAASSAWVVLDHGRQGDYLWSVKARRSGGPAQAGAQRDGREPCLLVGTKWMRSRFSYGRSRYRQCADAETGLAATEAPLIASGMVPGSGPNPSLTAVGMIFASRVRRVRITYADGTKATIGADTFTVGQSNESGLAGLRYAAFSVAGSWCPVRLVSLSGSGRPLWEGEVDKPPC
ncbi:MAG TPA: hypothetical protein VHQ97_09435 [Solirubrobacterales bacterium]|jgi:hypothetical protein|nr:hypothetical protein [Solirubrobacterales bacterium]